MRGFGRRGFTMFELLTTVAVITILGVIVVLIINPIELRKNARDSNRLSDLKNLSETLDFYKADVRPNPSAWGSTTTVYISVPDPTASTPTGNDCSGLGLPPLSPGWTYHCAGPNYYRKVDGTGWMPVNLAGFSFGEPFATLPVDPINDFNRGYYYSYLPCAQDRGISVPLEAKKYLDKSINDQGVHPGLIESPGCTTNEWALGVGLVGYWKFDDASGLVGGSYYPAADTSPNNNMLPYYQSYSQPQVWRSGKVGGALFIDNRACGNVALIQKSNQPAFNFGATDSFSFGGWVQFVVIGTCGPIATQKPISHGGSVGAGYYLGYTQGTNTLLARIRDGSTQNDLSVVAPSSIQGDGKWHHLFATVNRSSNQFTLYIDGTQIAQTAVTVGDVSNTNYFEIGAYSWPIHGYVDEVRLYKRALAPGEVQALYNGAK